MQHLRDLKEETSLFVDIFVFKYQQTKKFLPLSLSDVAFNMLIIEFSIKVL